MHFPGPGLLLKGLLLSILVASPSDAIDLDISDERTSYHIEMVYTGMKWALIAFERQNLSKMLPAQPPMR